MVLVIVAIALLGGIGPAAYYLLWANHAEDRRAAAKVGQAADRASKGKPPPVPTRERWVDVEKPSNGVADDTEQRPRATPRKRRAKHRARRGSARARRPRATRPRTAAPRAAARVPITMYMAHW